MWILYTMVTLLTECQLGIKSLFTRMVSDLQGNQKENDGILVENVPLEEDKELCILFSSRNNARPLPGEPFMVPVDVEEGVGSWPTDINSMSP